MPTRLYEKYPASQERLEDIMRRQEDIMSSKPVNTGEICKQSSQTEMISYIQNIECDAWDRLGTQMSISFLFSFSE